LNSRLEEERFRKDYSGTKKTGISGSAQALGELNIASCVFRIARHYFTSVHIAKLNLLQKIRCL
jgi:hypothetical protein